MKAESKNGELVTGEDGDRERQEERERRMRDMKVR